MGMIDSFTQLIFNIYEAFTVALFVREKEKLECLSSVSFAGSFDRGRSIPVEGTLPGWVLKHNEPLIIPNFDKDESSLGYYGAAEEIKSFMGYPMEERGVLVVDSKRKYVFTDKEKKILGSFVSVIREELERQKAAQETEEKIEELRVEKRIIGLFGELTRSRVSIPAILEECIQLSGGDLCFVAIEKNGKFLIDELAGPYHAPYRGREYPLGSSITSMVMEGGRELLLPYGSGLLKEKAFLFDGEEIRVKQFFGFPLLSDDAAFGVVGVVSLTDRHLKDSIGLLREVCTLLSLHYVSLWTKNIVERSKDFEPLTGSIHFPAFLRIMDKAMKKGNRFALLSVKLLHLKTYNRKMGYPFTDDLLRKVSQVIRYYVGANAFITRQGGGHFFVLLNGNDINDIRSIVKILHYTINKSLADDKIIGDTNLLKTGMSAYPGDGTDLWEVLDAAEANNR
jgi:diguanylate cyclase (GGDEF)-like protein